MEKSRNKRSCAAEKKRNKLNDARFEEDNRPNISLAEQILFKKAEPSYIQPKIRLSPVKWSEEETKQFYRILELIGIDFTVMEQFFPKRSRKQLLRKFHKEKKKNPQAIDMALKMHQNIKTAPSRRFDWLMNNSADFKFSESNSSSFDSTEQVRSAHQMINNHIKSVLEEETRERSNDPELRPLDYYLDKLDDEDRTTIADNRSDPNFHA